MSTSSDAPRNLEAWRNRMPIVAATVAEAGVQAAAGNDYVLMGTKDSWLVKPVSLTIDGIGTRDVAAEDRAYASRGWRLAENGTYDGTARLEDGTEVSVKVNVNTCC